MKRKGNLGGIFAMALILVLTLVLSVGSGVGGSRPSLTPETAAKMGSNVTWTLDSKWPAGPSAARGDGELPK